MNIWYATNENAVLSNLAARPFNDNGNAYVSVEHAYQTLKSGVFDPIVYCKPWKGGSKFVGTRPVDRSISRRCMKYLIQVSLEQNPDVLRVLLDTGCVVLTHNQDRGYWNKEFPAILMELRKELRKEGGVTMKTLKIYIDGSYSTAKPDITGWGFVSSDGTRKHGHLSGGIVEMNHIGGELSAACEAILYAKKHGADEVVIMHDYIGVAAWANSEWKTNNQWTQKYKAWIAKQRQAISIRFTKISGDDNPADVEARKATGAGDAHAGKLRIGPEGLSVALREALTRFPKGTVALPQNMERDSVPAKFLVKHKGMPEEIVWMYNKNMKPKWLGVLISLRMLGKGQVYQWIAERRKAKYVCEIEKHALYMF